MDNRYAELAVTTNFSFLRGASHPEEMVVEAARLGLSGISVTDRNSLAGVVRAHMAAKEAKLAFAPGCRLVFADGTPDILVWPQDRQAYGHLCELLTLGKRRAPKGECHLALDDLLTHGDGLLMALVLPTSLPVSVPTCLQSLMAHFSGQIYLCVSCTYGAFDQRYLAAIARIARQNRLPLLAIGNVLYHQAERRFLQDILTCIREHLPLRAAGKQLQPNAERHLRDAGQMLRLFKGYEYAIAETQKLFRRLSFSLDELQYQYPQEPTGSALPPQETLEKLTASGLKARYPEARQKRFWQPLRMNWV